VSDGGADASTERRFERRRDWTREEWIVAFDACPKDRQRYSATSRDVLEIAYLINRTPAAVSRSFANIWAAMTDGREGLANYAALCGQVVVEYRHDYSRLHRDALSLRTQFLRDSLAPRLEVRVLEGESLLEGNLRPLAVQVARETGIPRRRFIIYRRQGSLLEGVVLVLFGALAAPLGERFVRWIESHLRRPRTPERIEILRSQTWVAFGEGKHLEVERRVVLHYLPDARDESMSPKSRAALARYLAAILGVARVVGRQPAPTPRRVTARRVAEIESRIGASLRGLPKPALAELDALLEVADTKGLRKTIQKLHQTRLDDYEGR
jgi:hypothetical protein